MATIAIYVLRNFIKNCMMSDEEFRLKMRDQDMIEMRELMAEREYLEEAGKVLLPSAV
jgi:hypothetical protein